MSQNGRSHLYRQLAEQRASRVLVYVTGDRPGLETRISSDVIDRFGDLLDDGDHADRITLYLYTLGGDIFAAWNIVNLIREYTDFLEVVVPSKCLSAGTLICLGANNIVMTRQACLGPVDPSINNPLNPQMPGKPEGETLPMSVEDVAGFIRMAKTEAQVQSEEYLAQIYRQLADYVHPIALGNANRARGQIKELTRKLLLMHMTEADPALERIVDAICKETSSHDFAIYRTHARQRLGMKIEIPDTATSQTIRAIHQNVREQLQLNKRFDLATSPVGNYSFKRALLESEDDGFCFMSEGVVHREITSEGALTFRNELNYEDWRRAGSGAPDQDRHAFDLHRTNV